MLGRISTTLITLAFVISLPTVTLAEHHEKKGKAGGQAAEHRSDRAADRSNAQWQEESEKGHKHGKKDKDKKGKGKKEKKEKKGNKDKDRKADRQRGDDD